MDYKEIFEQLRVLRKVTAFEEWMESTIWKINRRTYYRAIEQGGRTPRQQKALELSAEYYEAEVQNKALVAEAV